jgi:hypothetical protein
MKNIHIIQTDKPSRLRYNLSNQLVLTKESYKVNYGEEANQHIYITYDEEIKDDWCYDEYNKVVFKNTGPGTPGASKKIILTTDPSLDGVQAIDDDFLEWFVQNPSCEFVEVIYGLYNPMGRKVSSEKVSENHSQCVWKYKIIIPQEEPKQETLEEAATNLADPNLCKTDNWIAGANWQAEQQNLRLKHTEALLANCEKALDKAIKKSKQMYSEEEVMDMFHNFSMHLPLHYEFLVKEQFKKK